MGAFRCRVAEMAGASVPPPPPAGERHAGGVFFEGAGAVNFTGSLAAFHVAGKRDAGQVQKSFRHGMNPHVDRLTLAQTRHGSAGASFASMGEPTSDRRRVLFDAFVLPQPSGEITQAGAFIIEHDQLGPVAV